MAKFRLPQAITDLMQRGPFAKRNKTGSHMRAHARHGCVLIAELMIAEKGFKIDGMVIELSRGGIRFREASNYILDRRGTKVTIIVGGNEYPGVIVNMDTHGYGIKLDSLMPEEELDKMTSGGVPGLQFGGAPVAAEPDAAPQAEPEVTSAPA